MRGRLIMLGGLVGLAGCTDPVVTMRLELPANAATFSTSCVTTVEMRAEGLTYPGDPTDYKSIAIAVTNSPPTYADVETAIRGRFAVPIPPTGLKAVSLFGWNGSPGWDDLSRDDSQGSDLVFFGRGAYGDSDTISVGLTTNINCTTQPVTIHSVDLVAFLTHNRDCAMAISPDDPNGNAVYTGTMTPTLDPAPVSYFGDYDGQAFVANTASFQAAAMVGPDSCFAMDGGADAQASWSVGCASSGPGVCGGSATDLEMPTIIEPYDTNSFDPAIVHQFPGVTIGGVFTAGKVPIQGATIDVDAAVGKVVYADLDTANKKFSPTGGTATSASGLFIIYSAGIVNAKFTAGASTRTVKVGAPIGDVSGLTVVF